MATFPPPGLTIETWAAVIVTPEIPRLMRSPAVPLKRSSAFSPGDVVVTLTGGPPALIGYACVALPVTLRVVDAPPTEAVTENVTAPRSAGVKVPL